MTPDRTLAYGPLPEHLVDVRLPSTAAPATSGPSPLVVVVHGGFWKQEYDRSHTAEQSAGLAAAGFVVATVEYRRVSLPGGGSPGGRSPGGGWPGTLDDAALFADTVPGLVAEAFPGRVDVSRVCFIGHSAGGHLAAWVAARHRLPAGSPWHLSARPAFSVVSLAGVLDLELADRLGLGDHATRGLLGGSAADRPERYAAASPARLLPTGVRTVLVHGTDDDVVPIEVSRTFAAAAAAAGDDVRLHELPGVEHFAVIEPGSAAWPAVLAAVAESLG